MFGDILIDKLRISLKLNCEFNPYKAQELLDDIISKHFRKGNYTVNFDKSYFRVTFTPTLYLDDVMETEDKPILNIQMPETSKFLLLLKQIYKVLGRNAVITWIDITKDVLTLLDANEYIKALSKRKYKFHYNKSEYTSQTNCVTLTLSPRKRNDVVDCKIDNRKITFYSKVSQIKSKTKTRFIDNVSLSDEEKELFSEEEYKGIYIAETGRLYIDNLKILRCEQRFKFSNNIKRITNILTGSKEMDKLTLALFIEYLENGELYKKLDEFYTNELRKHVFYDDINENMDIKLNKHEEITKDCLNKYDIDINDFQFLFEETGFKKQFAYSRKKVQYHTQGKYYKELFKKFKI